MPGHALARFSLGPMVVAKMVTLSASQPGTQSLGQEGEDDETTRNSFPPSKRAHAQEAGPRETEPGRQACFALFLWAIAARICWGARRAVPDDILAHPGFAILSFNQCYEGTPTARRHTDNVPQDAAAADATTILQRKK